MGGKWKYKRLNLNNEEEEEETVLIDQSILIDQSDNQLNHQIDPCGLNSSNYGNPFDPINTEAYDDQTRYELKQRNNGTQKVRVQQQSAKDDSVDLVEYCVKPNDSLLSIALSCNCSVEELKRVNKLITDQEFFALRYIKIPVRKYGLLSEVLIHQLNRTNEPISLQQIKESLSNHQLNNLVSENVTNLTNNLINHLSNHPTTSSSNHTDYQPLINFNADHEEQNKDQHIPKNEPNASSSSKSSSTNSLIINVGLKKTFDFDKTNGDLNKFLIYLDKDLEKMRKLANQTISPSIIEPLDSNDLYLLNSSQKANSFLDCDDVYCGLTWKSVFFIAIFICILIPLIYLAISTEEHLNHHLNHH